MMEHDYRDVLLKAASLVEEGWFAFRKAGYVETNPGSENECAVTSTNRAAHELGLPRAVEKEADAVLERYLGTSAVTWNDAEDRTQAEVAEALRRAAE